MRHALLLALLAISSPSARADDLTLHGGVETVTLKGSLSFLRCEAAAGQATQTCHRADVPAQPFSITLNTAKDAKGITGDHALTAAQDGMKFEATISVSKTYVNGFNYSYKVEAYLDESSDADPESSSFDFVGRATVKQELSGLNEIMWSGKALKSGNITLTPFLTLSH